MRIKLMSMGPAASGKSCLIKRFCEERFVSKYISTIGVDYGVKPYSANGTMVKLNFWDLSGDPEVSPTYGAECGARSCESITTPLPAYTD